MTTTDLLGPVQTADWLLTPEAIRHQCEALFELALARELRHFTVDLDRLGHAAGEVVTTIRNNYPDLKVPPHARWRHFVLNDRDRWAEAAARLEVSAQERARLECELAIVSVLLDAGAGPKWRYRDMDSGLDFARSEGLALASLEMFLAGAFNRGRGAGTTAKALQGFSTADLVIGLQVSEDNPLEGLAGRAALISAVGDAVAAQPEVFGEVPRLGLIADHLFALADDEGHLPAPVILQTILSTLGRIWPDTPEMAGKSLGDCWAHPQAPGSGMVPFHKLSQWLSYSLIEPLERVGLTITEMDQLTGLAEYRNGGLFLDTEVIALRNPAQVAEQHAPDSDLIIEWRALTVCLLDRVAEAVRQQLGLSAEELPLAAVLEGGTWATGRRLARAKRPGGTPPLTIQSSGTVF